MEFWRTTLTNLTPTRLIPDSVEWNVGWVGDASTKFGIGVIIGKKWAQFEWLPGWSTPAGLPKRSIAWAETVAVRLGLLMVKRTHDISGRTLCVLSNNTTTNGVAKNYRSRDFWVNQEWKVIQTHLIKWQTTLSLHYVKSVDNEADQLSRGLDPSKKLKDCLTVVIPEDLDTLLRQVFP